METYCVILAMFATDLSSYHVVPFTYILIILIISAAFFFHCHALSAYRTHYTEEEPACLPLNFRTNAADFGRVVAIIKLSQHIAVNIAYILVMQLAHFVFEYSDNTWDGYKYRTFLARNEAESLVSLTDSTIEKETSIDEYGSCSVLNL